MISQKLVAIYALFLGVNVVGQKLSVLQKNDILQLWQKGIYMREINVAADLLHMRTYRPYITKI